MLRLAKILCMAMLLAGCGNSHEITGEVMLHSSDKLKIKVVQIYTAMPMHYYGLNHEVRCQSIHTLDKNWPTVEKGWERMASLTVSRPGQSPGDEVKKMALEEALAEGKSELQILDESTIIHPDNNLLQITFNGCGEIRKWSPWTLPEDWVIQVKKSQNCLDGKCPWENFAGDKRVTFTNIKVDTVTQHISFIAHSSAFKQGDIQVASADGGQHWTLAQVDAH